MPRKAQPVPQVAGNPQAPARLREAPPPDPARAPIPPTPGRPARQPVRAPTGMGYGERQQLENAQRAAPLPGSAPVVAPPADPQQERLARGIEQARGMPFDEVPIGAPTQRAAEPLTAGVGVGPGPGPEVLGFNKSSRVASTFQAIADATGDPEVARLAEIAQSQRA